MLLPYLLIMLVFCGCAFFFEFTSNEERRRQITYVALGVFFVFFAFRGYINTDWTVYYNYFEKVEWGDLFEWEFGSEEVYEPGFTLLCLLCKSVIPHYLFLQIVVSTINVWLLYRFIQRLKMENASLVFCLFIAFSGMSIFFNLLRNSIAILLFLNALEYISERKPLQYFGLCLFALSIHTSALAFFPLYFFFHFRMNRWIFLACFCVFAGMYLMKISIVVTLLHLLGVDAMLESKVETYTELVTGGERSGLSLGFFERVGTAVLVTIYYDKLKELRPNCAIIINGLLFYFFFFFCLADFGIISTRMSMLFVYSYWIIWVDLLRCFYYENNRYLFMGFILLYSMIKIVPTIQKPVQEYDNMLFGIKSYEERLNIFNGTFEDDN